MPVELDSQLESAIREKVESGQYSDVNDVVREALELLDERDRYARLQAAVNLGLEDVTAGRVRPWTSNRLAELRTEADAEDRQNAPIAADVQP